MYLQLVDFHGPFHGQCNLSRNLGKYGIHGSYGIETHRLDFVPREQEGDLIEQLSLQSQSFLCVSESCILIFPTVETV